MQSWVEGKIVTEKRFTSSRNDFSQESVRICGVILLLSAKLVRCVFCSPQSIQPSILEHFIIPSAGKLYGDADFIIQDNVVPILALTMMVSLCLISQQTGLGLKLKEYFPSCQESEEYISKVNNGDQLKANVIKTSRALLTAADFCTMNELLFC